MPKASQQRSRWLSEAIPPDIAPHHPHPAGVVAIRGRLRRPKCRWCLVAQGECRAQILKQPKFSGRKALFYSTSWGWRSFQVEAFEFGRVERVGRARLVGIASPAV